MTRLLVGGNTPYSDRPWPAETWRLLDRLQPEEIRVTSFVDGDDLDRLLRQWPQAIYHVRPRTGPEHQGAWPLRLLDYRSWDTERSLRDCLDAVVSRNVAVWLEAGNEPDIEMAREPVDDWPNIRDATAAYADWFHRLADDVAGAYGDMVRLAVAPLSQGSPDRFAWWKARLVEAGCYGRASFVSEHLYTNGRPHDDPDWGGRWAAWSDLDLPIDVTEIDDNGAFADDLTARAADIGAFLRTLATAPRVRSGSLFTTRGAPNDDQYPAWWFVDDLEIDEAVTVRAESLVVPPAPTPEPAPAPPPEVTPVPTPDTLPLGIDVSNNQGPIRWDQVASAGVTFMLAKATEGIGFEDGYLPANWDGARANGLLRGAYDFARPDLVGPEAEADYFLDYVEACGLETGDLLALDLEDDEGSLERAALPVGAWALRWLQRVEARAGFKPALYTSLNEILGHDLAAYPELGDFPLWLASWGSVFPAAPAPWGAVSLWQYSANGSVPGINGQVDLNRWNGPLARLPLLGKPAPTPPTDETQVLRDQVGGLAVALADMNDREGDKIRAVLGELDGPTLAAKRRHALLAQVRAALAEMDATRAEFVGPRG